MRIHLGCGTKLYPPPWVNVDTRVLASDDPNIQVRQADALNLEVEDGTVELLFSNAVFEHIYFARQIPVLLEWARALAPDGLICTLGVPDFETIATCYVTGAKGITGPTFDLFETYRYALGFPEGHLAEWDWHTPLPPDQAPSAYLAQIHKALFDSHTLHQILGYAGLQHVIFRYRYLDEPHPINLGFLAGHTQPTLDQLWDVPLINEYIEDRHVEVIERFGFSRAADIANWLDDQ